MPDITENENAKPTWKIVERGIHHYSKTIKYEYIVEMDETGKKRKYAFRPGECVELDPETDKFIDIVDFVSPELMKG